MTGGCQDARVAQVPGLNSSMWWEGMKEGCVTEESQQGNVDKQW